MINLTNTLQKCLTCNIYLSKLVPRIIMKTLDKFSHFTKTQSTAVKELAPQRGSSLQNPIQRQQSIRYPSHHVTPRIYFVFRGSSDGGVFHPLESTTCRNQVDGWRHCICKVLYVSKGSVSCQHHHQKPSATTCSSSQKLPRNVSV